MKVTLGIFLAAFLLLAVTSSAADLDIWHEMALIRESIAAGHLLTNDVFAYTPTAHPAVDHEWGAGVILYGAVAGLGGWAVILLKYALAFAIAFLCCRVIALRGTAPDPLGYAAAVLLAPIAILLFGLGWATLRAQVYSFFFLVVLLYFVQLDRRGKRGWIFLWAPLFVLWVNLHGGCIVGIGVLVLCGLERFLRKEPALHLLGGAVLSVALMGVNPYGGYYYRHLWNTMTMPRPELIEWGPIWQFSNVYQFLFISSLAIAAYAWIPGGTNRLRHGSGLHAMPDGVFLLAGLAAAGALYVRMLPMYAMVWICYVPAAIAQTAAGNGAAWLFRKTEWVTAASLVGAVFSLGLWLPREPWRIQVPEAEYPIGAVQYLADSDFRGNVFTPFNQGAYLSWRLFPRVKVSLDSRYDIAYPREIVLENRRFYAAETGWQATLQRYPTDLVLLQRTDPVAAKLEPTGWRRTYVDQNFALYARPGLSLPMEDATAKHFSDALR